MREIRYRGKRLDNGEWVYGYLFYSKRFNRAWILIEHELDDRFGGAYVLPNDMMEKYEVNPETVGKYTGLKDKNGKEIYEGDVLQRISDLSEQTYYYKVEWDAEYARFMSISISGTLRELVSSTVERGCTVCGTIHDNPELLKGENT